MMGLNKHVQKKFDEKAKNPVDNLGSDQLKNNIRKLVDDWKDSGDQWIKDYLKKMNPLGTYPRNGEMESKCDIQSLLCEVLNNCQKRMNEKDIHAAIETIRDICYATNYPALDKRLWNDKSPHQLRPEEEDLIKKIGEMQVFKEDKIADAVQVSIEDQLLSDEPLGCYARPGMINSREIKYPTIVLYIKEIEAFANKHNLRREDVSSFVYLYQLCRVYFDRYPYANLLKYKKWNCRESLYNEVVSTSTIMQDSVTRDDSISSIERPIVAMTALYYADSLDKNIFNAGEEIIADKNLYLNWQDMSEWQQDGLTLYNDKQFSLIDKYRKVAIFLSGKKNEKDKRFSFLDEYMNLLKD